MNDVRAEGHETIAMEPTDRVINITIPRLKEELVEPCGQQKSGNSILSMRALQR